MVNPISPCCTLVSDKNKLFPFTMKFLNVFALKKKIKHKKHKERNFNNIIFNNYIIYNNNNSNNKR